MYPIAINVNAPSKLDTVICVVVPQSTEGEVAPLAPALLSVTDINGMSLKGSSKYIEHLLFMFALTSEDIVNCIMRSLSIFIFLRVAFLQFVTLLVTSLFSTLNKFSTVENLFKYSEIFNGRAATKGQMLGSIPDNSKFIEINYVSDSNFYYFQPIILRTEIVRNKDVALVIGITSDIREFILSFKNNIITITHSMITNSTADNNFIAQILSVNA